VKRWVLMNPGPVNVTPRVRKALLGPDLCHRETEFSDLVAGIRRRLVRLFGIARTHTAALFTGSGTAALEAMLSSFAEKNKRVLVLSNGVYGDRMKQILELHGAPVTVLKSEIGGFPSTEKIEALLRGDGRIKALAMVHHETSSGMLNPLADVAKLAKKYKKTFLVDAVSSLGAERLDLRSIDYCAGSAGKCLHGYPGVSFVLLSKKEAAELSGRRSRTLYLDLANTLKHQEKDDTPFTPAVQLFYAFDEALKELEKQGLSARIRLYERRSRLLEEGFRKLGLRFLVENRVRSHVLTSVWVPSGVRYEKLHAALKKRGFIIYAGQSSLAGKIFRVSNLGDMSSGDILRFLAVLKKALS
jgi:2-aminoethylphosphonate-pyruvate transaminase